MGKLSPQQLAEVRDRHGATLFIDWEKEFDPEWQPNSLSNVELCHLDRERLLDHITALEKEAGVEG